MPQPLRAQYSRLQRNLLALRLAPHWLYHYVFAPYRRDVGAIAYHAPILLRRQRVRAALYDAMFGRLFACYTELTGFSLVPTTGKAVFFLRQALTAFDSCFEQRLNDNLPVRLEDIQQEEVVRLALEKLFAYARLLGKANEIHAYLRQLFADYYSTYQSSSEQAYKHENYASILAAAELDSGLLARVFVEFASVCNGHALSIHASQQLFAFGMIAKFVDDLVDVERDMVKKSPNLALALLREIPAEFARFAELLPQSRRRNHRWWKRFPLMYGRYFDAIEAYYARVSTHKLQYLCRIIMLPAILGYDFDAAKQP